MKIFEILNKYPFVENFFEANEFDVRGKENLTFREYLDNLSIDRKEDLGVPIEVIEDNLDEFIKQMLDFIGDDNSLKTLTIISGESKTGEKENFDTLVLSPSDVISIVGPTGSGKSRLLADIEWMARGDTPTKRRILINGEEVSTAKRFSNSEKLVAQLSQNMNFVMDLTVLEYIELHAKSRLIDAKDKIDRILEDANTLCGERFSLYSQITSLSGGQSRALMISDTANLSKSPIVLIDEIENAGIDRKKAVELLISRDKIVLMATHDPMLALMADKRIVINNGAVVDVIESTEEEREILKELERIDEYNESLRKKLRYGLKLK